MSCVNPSSVLSLAISLYLFIDSIKSSKSITFHLPYTIHHAHSKYIVKPPKQSRASWNYCGSYSMCQLRKYTVWYKMQKKKRNVEHNVMKNIFWFCRVHWWKRRKKRRERKPLYFMAFPTTIFELIKKNVLALISHHSTIVIVGFNGMVWMLSSNNFI